MRRASMLPLSRHTMCMILLPDTGEVITGLITPELARHAVERAAPIREAVPYRQKRSYEGEYWSSTMRHHVRHESFLERQFCVEADWRRDIVAWSWQPMLLTWPAGTPKRRNHVPDYFCRLSNGDGLVVDVKSADKVDAYADQFELTRAACERVGWQYEVFTGHAPQYRMNLEYLGGYNKSRYAPTDSVRDVILAAYSGGPSFEFGMRQIMRDANLSESAARTGIYHLLWHQQPPCGWSA